MQLIDQSKLSRYLEQSIEHDDNPQSFRFQMQTEIAKYLKIQQQKAKQAHSKMRQTLQRNQLMQRLEAKAKRGNQIKTQKLQDRTQSLIDLHRRRELLQAEKVKQNRKQQLLKSLKKIEEFQSKRTEAINFRLNKSANEAISHSASRLTIREESENARYDALVHQLQKKGLFSMPSRQLNSLYQKKVKKFRESKSKQEEKREDKLGASLSKIEQARQRKEALLFQRSKRLQEIEKYQQDLKKGKLKELEALQRKKRKSLQAKQALKILKGQQIMSASRQTMSKQEEPIEIEVGQEMVKVKNPSYRDKIRKHIEHFMMTKIK